MIILPQVMLPEMVQRSTIPDNNQVGDRLFDVINISELDTPHVYGREVEEDNLVVESGYLCDRYGTILNREYCLTLDDLIEIREMLHEYQNAGPFIIMPNKECLYGCEWFPVSEIVSWCRIFIAAQAIYLFDSSDDFLESKLNKKGCPAALVAREQASTVIGVFLSH